AVAAVHSHAPPSESTSASSPISPSLSPSPQFGGKNLFCQLDASRSWLDVRKLKRDVESRMPSRRAEERSEEAQGRDQAEEAEGPQWRRDEDGETEDASTGRRKAGLEDDRSERQDAHGTDSEWSMRVMTFNVLAESLTDYKYRSLFFRSLGYEGVYKQKTHGREDGVGTFWLRDRFELVEQRGIEFRHHSKRCETFQNSECMQATLYARTQMTSLPDPAYLSPSGSRLIFALLRCDHGVQRHLHLNVKPEINASARNTSSKRCSWPYK
ncbi:endonuclease/exonuclease/phosphatase family protein, partial [Toxoplasma gondii MAS]